MKERALGLRESPRGGEANLEGDLLIGEGVVTVLPSPDGGLVCWAAGRELAHSHQVKQKTGLWVQVSQGWR